MKTYLLLAGIWACVLYMVALRFRRFDPDQIVTRASLAAAVALTLILGLYGCGGGGPATAEEIAQHDADVQAMALQHDKTILPVSCANGACK